jgi:hypothetical protein
MKMNLEHRTSNIEHSTSDGIGDRVCFVHHSPPPWANDEQSRRHFDCHPGLRLLRSLTLDYYRSPFQGCEMVSIQRLHPRGGCL